MARSSPRVRPWARLVLSVLVASASCTPTDSTGPDEPTVAAVTVTSPADSVLSLSTTTVQLTATATSSSGQTVPNAGFTWASSNAGVAAVSASGLVTVGAAGTTTITATSGTVSGQLRLRIIDADLAGVTLATSDAFATGLIGSLASATQSSVNTQMSACGGGMSSGSMLAVYNCLSTLLALSGNGGGTDTAVLAVLDLYWEHAMDLLNFGR